MKTVALLLLFAITAHAQSTRNNDSSCDVVVTPAATLLVPYFEVDFTQPLNRATTTIFSIVNTSANPQIANITLWTDWAYPVLAFDTWLTGYDVASINLRDILGGGALPSTNGATAQGPRSRLTNPQFRDGARAICFPLGGPIPAELLADVRSALTTGTSPACPKDRVGGTHANAIGYITIDVVATCAPALPTEEGYYTRELLFDNVLIGDYMQISPNPTTGNYAGASPMVHIRAMPEGGNAGESIYTNLPYTFYDRYTPRSARTLDRRQPLPSTFAARYIQGGTSGFSTDFIIWREGVNDAAATCIDRINDSIIPLVETVRFDERENPTTNVRFCPFLCRIDPFSTPAASRTKSSNSIFPALTSGDVAGWIYMNITNAGSKAYSVAPGRIFPKFVADPRPSQNWVVVSLSAEGRYSVLMDAASLGNGCSPAPAVNDTIQPASNVTP